MVKITSKKNIQIEPLSWWFFLILPNIKLSCAQLSIITTEKCVYIIILAKETEEEPLEHIKAKFARMWCTTKTTSTCPTKAVPVKVAKNRIISLKLFTTQTTTKLNFVKTTLKKCKIVILENNVLLLIPKMKLLLIWFIWLSPKIRIFTVFILKRLNALGIWTTKLKNVFMLIINMTKGEKLKVFTIVSKYAHFYKKMDFVQKMKNVNSATI